MRYLLLFILCSFAENMFAQTYEKTNLLNKQVTFSHLRLLDDAQPSGGDIFEIRGKETYLDDEKSSSYQVSYFKGDAQETYAFLSSLVELAEYVDTKDGVVAYINGVRVESCNALIGHSFRVFDKEERVYCYYTVRQWSKVFDTFATYCDENKIVYRDK